MKFLVIPSFVALNSLIANYDNGQTIIQGRLEAYSCKAAGTDKKLYKHLNTSLEHQLGSSDPTVALSSSLGSSFDDSAAALEKLISPRFLSPLSTSPFGALGDAQSRRTFISLIQVLNASFPDYDFSELSPEDFRREDPNLVRANITNLLPALSTDGSLSLQASIWQALETEIRIADCEIFSYKTDPDHDPFSEQHTLWYFNYFFYNKKLKRVVFFPCRAISKLAIVAKPPASPIHSDDDDDDDEPNHAMGDYEEGVFDQMEA